MLNQRPSAFGHLARVDVKHSDRLSSLRTIVSGPEALVFANLRGWLEKYGDAKPRLENIYGITETTVHVTYRLVSLSNLDSTGSLIGLPLPDLCIEQLDESGWRVPTGAIGEIHVCGAGVLQGYLGKEALIRERFVDLELEPGRVQRFYRDNAPANRITFSLSSAASDSSDIRQLVRSQQGVDSRSPQTHKLFRAGGSLAPRGDGSHVGLEPVGQGRSPPHPDADHYSLLQTPVLDRLVEHLEITLAAVEGEPRAKPQSSG